MFRKMSVYRKLLVLFSAIGGYLLLHEYLHRSESSSKPVPEPITLAERRQGAVRDSSLTDEHSAAHVEPIPEPVARENDDLRLIDGIGPKTAGALNEAGITTFNQLANLTIIEIKQLLKIAGVRAGNIAAWPEQARLAADGDWDGLKALLSSMK